MPHVEWGIFFFTNLSNSNPMNIISIHFVSSHSVLLVNAKGRLKKLYTPFRVICTEPHGALTVGTRLYVDEVYATNKDELVYIINGQSYLHKNISIPV